MNNDKTADVTDFPISRWWENYFIRYALGTVVGAVIVRALATLGLSSLFPGMTSQNLNAAEGYLLIFTQF